MKINFDYLIERGLVKQKKYANGLAITKYAKKVFYDNLWDVDCALLDARGIVTNEHNGIVVWPFTKIFNYGENGTTLPLDQEVVWVEKVNGFLGCVTATMDYGVIYSTTGSIDSDFVELIKKHVSEYDIENARLTYMFEIVDETDPHIVEHEPGAYLIGARILESGDMVDEDVLDWIAEDHGWKRPKWGEARFGDVVKMAQEVKHEGFVVRDLSSGELLLKIKSPHYLSKKFIMRMGAGKVKAMWENPEQYKQIIDEEFAELVEYLTSTFSMEVWVSASDQERRQVIERFFETGAFRASGA